MSGRVPGINAHLRTIPATSMHEPIHTERLLLRPFREDDLGPCHAMWSDPAVGPWVGGTHTELQESVHELRHHMEHQTRHGFAFWAVEERESGLLVGEVGLQHFEGRGPDVETGWCLVRPAWGRGYAIEAARAWLTVGFEQLRLDRIIAVVLPDNARSRRVCDRLGMHEAGRRQAYGAEHVEYVTRAPPRPAAR
jgi:RimJ/RimL family protein N-acetyltransferase